MNKNAMNKTRTAVSAPFLITNRTYVQAISDATSHERRRSQIALTVSTMGDPIQKPEWPELIAESPAGAYDGRAKWAAVDVPCSAVSSLTTPSSGEEAQAERSHATTNTRIPHHAEHLFTMLNLLIAESGATSGTGGLMPKKSGHEKFCVEREARV